MALTGPMEPDLMLATAEADWVHDTAVFGPMNKTAFFDVLHELVG